MTALGYREDEKLLLRNPQLMREMYANGMTYASSADGTDAGDPVTVTAGNAKWSDVKIWGEQYGDELESEIEKYREARSSETQRKMVSVYDDEYVLPSKTIDFREETKYYYPGDNKSFDEWVNSYDRHGTVAYIYENGKWRPLTIHDAILQLPTPGITNSKHAEGVIVNELMKRIFGEGKKKE